MIIHTTHLNGVLLLELETHEDARGAFTELFVDNKYAKLHDIGSFVQDNYSTSCHGVIRGLHYQRHYPQGKLLTVLQGHILDIVVDINPHSSTFAQHLKVELHGVHSAKNKERSLQLWIPPGYAHGFCVLSEQASIFYKCTQTYRSGDECGILWNDPDLAIQWPITDPIISFRDQTLPTLQEYIAQLPERGFS